MPCLLEEVPGLLAAEADHCHQVGRVPAVPEELEPHAGARRQRHGGGESRVRPVRGQWMDDRLYSEVYIPESGRA